MEMEKVIENIVTDLRNKADYCHNNISSKTWEDWEKMDKFLVSMADRISEAVEIMMVKQWHKGYDRGRLGYSEPIKGNINRGECGVIGYA